MTGHPAALARLVADQLITEQPDGSRTVTEAGRAALNAWRALHGDALPAPPPTIHPKLPGKQHEAVITAALRPDQLVPGRDDHVGDPWFNERTLAAVHRAGLADVRPRPWSAEPVTYEKHGGALYLTPAGREYARQRGNIPCSRRRIVIISCGEKQAPHPGFNEFGKPLPGYPAGELYIGNYHRSLRKAADALTDQSLIRILSSLHGLVPLERSLLPYDCKPGAPNAIGPEDVRRHAAALALDDADVIFLGGGKHADLLTGAVPHALAPLTGDLLSHRAQCRDIRESAGIQHSLWETAAKRFADHAAASARRIR